jgi:hypothetical protein
LIQWALKQLSATGSSRKEGDEFIIEAEMEGATVAPDARRVHTPTMTLKGAALLALVGTILMTVLLVWNFVSNVVYVLRGVEAPIVLFASLIYAFGCLTVMVFFFVFHRAQP